MSCCATIIKIFKRYQYIFFILIAAQVMLCDGSCATAC